MYILGVILTLLVLLWSSFVLVFMGLHRITSYNVCYTKLLRMSQTDLITGRIQGVISQPYAFTHDIYIDEALEYPADWRNELHTIRTAQMNDVINIT